MTDWNKLKVVDLKAELKKRGLAQTGLKPALVARLNAAESEDGSESEATIQGDAGRLDASVTSSPEVSSPTQQAADLGAEGAQDAPQPDSEPNNSLAEESMAPTTSITASPKDESRVEIETTEISRSTTEKNDDHKSALPSVEPQELLEDRSKRKRRSQSPPPTGTDSSRKRMRKEAAIEDVEGVVTTNIDSTWVENQNAVSKAEINITTEDAAPSYANLSMEGVNIGSVPGPESKKGDVMGEMEDKPRTEDIPMESTNESLSKLRNSKYKDLFSSQQAPSLDTAISRTSDPDIVETEPDRAISPAIHPATSALYIRDFMRPLNPTQLKAYLAELAAPPGRDPDPDVIINFYLDPIRTHAFISLTSVSAASRIRSSLHDRIWPEEQTRKPLWIDFIPAEKVDEWIQEEQATNTGGRSSSKRWEVYYDVNEDRHVTAQLQEASSFPRAQPNRKPSVVLPPPQIPTGPRSVGNAPSGPRATQFREQRSANNLSKLDQLFKFTTAKPVLYWLPVDKALADKRLDNIDHAASQEAAVGRVSGEINRYTFEDGDVLVDRGPEIFPGIRPPPGHTGPRGPRGSGHRGGGGYGRGRDRSYDRYRNDRRDFRDDRRY
ncbi:hypothetical protein BGZ60DRAFT_409111 [Tricladium varicosporioides]|nr:hypothetical protein BGZ60DRAFT_409111 [Hymenoscyphus varicosporioides]